jgi:hypothetical protein
VLGARRKGDVLEALAAEHGIALAPGQKVWYAKKQATLGADMLREYPSTFEEAFAVPLEGAIYAKELAQARRMGRIGRVPVDPGVAVNTFWDFGVDDANTIWLHQRVGAMNRFVGYIEGHNEGLRFYGEALEAWRLRHGCRWGRHFLPHDADTRMQGYELQTRREILEDLGLRGIVVVPRIQDLRDGIELCRRALPECEFDATACAEGIRALDHYSRQWDDSRGVWSSRPRHDWASHGADGFRCFAQGFRVERAPHAPEGLAGLYRGGY